MRYFPPSGTAGLDRTFVNGNKRVPAPPPITIANVRCVVPGGSDGVDTLESESRAPCSCVCTSLITQRLRLWATTLLRLRQNRSDRNLPALLCAESSDTSVA